MRWNALFEDFEAQLDAAAHADRDARISELTRAERAGIRLTDRLRGSLGAPIRLRLRDGRDVAGELDAVTGQWVLLLDAQGEVLVPLHAVDSVRGLSTRALPERSAVVGRLGLGHALRALSRDRVIVHIALVHGDVVGRIDAVGADHLEVLATSVAGGTGKEAVLVPFEALVCVTSASGRGWE